MLLSDFVRCNREEIDVIIQDILRQPRAGLCLNDSERRIWVVNNPCLMDLARKSGVKF